CRLRGLFWRRCEHLWPSVVMSVSVHYVFLIIRRCFGSRFTGMSIVDRALLRAWIVVPANVDVTTLLSHPGELCRLT
ncbi:unnamed protein product, partial [Ectocarpus sp. 12 AP-2014]